VPPGIPEAVMAQTGMGKKKKRNAVLFTVAMFSGSVDFVAVHIC
jgi:hypothetical protein